VDEFVPRDFDVPRRLETPLFVLEPLGPEHNAQDYDAWTSSMEHIHATPGWQDSSWPREMTPHENRADLQRHADDFRNRTGFTYTVLDPASRDVIGCVYIYPQRDSDYDARAHSWVRASHAHLDAPLWRAVSEWLASDWPFATRKVNEYLFEDKPARTFERIAALADCDVLVFGHTHKPWIRDYGGVRFVNCGSVGKPKDGAARAAFALLRAQAGDVSASIHRVPYDALAVAREMRTAGLPAELAEKLVAAA
jgi:diadenosine tetraphosphatase ApaH/serine/threonine PP2A family protein phosphatase